MKKVTTTRKTVEQRIAEHQEKIKRLQIKQQIQALKASLKKK